MTTNLLRCLPLLIATACTGGSGDPQIDPPLPDAAPTPDGSPTPDGNPPLPDAPPGTSATVVPCPAAGEDADVWYYDGIGYMGDPVEIPLGGIVRFHNLGSHTADHTAGLWSASGDADQCVRFDALGVYPYACYFHPAQDTGTITVVSPN